MPQDKSQSPLQSPVTTSELPCYVVIGFAGHRNLQDAGQLASVMAATLDALKTEFKGRLLAVSSVAAGADSLFASHCTSTGIPWKAILPLQKQLFEKELAENERQVTNSLLQCAYAVETMPLIDNHEDAYLTCGIRIVDDCDVLLAVWDGSPARGRGGTADVIAYAREVKRPLIWIHAITGEVRRENFPAGLLGHDPELHRLNALPALAVGNPSISVRPPLEVLAFFKKVDAAASATAPQFRNLTAATILLHLLAILTALIAVVFTIHLVALPWLKVLFVAGAGIAAIYLWWRESHLHWIRCRLAAEICRSAIATWHLPGVYEPVDLDYLPQHRGLLRSLRYLKEAAGSSATPGLDASGSEYLQNRIDDQMRYYRERESYALFWLRILKLAFWTGTVVGAVGALLYAVTASAHQLKSDSLQQRVICYILPTAGPVVATYAMSLISVYDLRRRLSRYRQMQTELTKARQQITACRTWESLRRTVQHTERLLLAEVVEWYSTSRYAGAH